MSSHLFAWDISNIYSEASIGKAYYEELEIKSFFGYDNRSKVITRNTEFDLRDVGASMEGYYGGRSEARIRHQIIEGMHADFRSEYPTVNALMRLQELLLAERVDVIRNSSSAREFLETVTLDDLQQKETWPKLRGFARIRPSGDTLPLRCEYTNRDGEKSINVGVNYVSVCGYYRVKADNRKMPRDFRDDRVCCGWRTKNQNHQDFWRS